MTRPDLDALEALAAKATPGPWWQEPFGLIVSQNENESGKRAFIAAPTGDANATLIVAAVNTLPALIKRVRELERERQNYRAMRDNGGSTHWDIAEVGAICHSECAVAQIQRLAARVRELERERDAAATAMREKCAKACEAATWPDSATWARDFAAAIRALEA